MNLFVKLFVGLLLFGCSIIPIDKPEAVITWPDCPSHNTGNNATVILQHSSGLQTGDLAAVFAGDDCVGQTVIGLGSTSAVTVWGDDSFTPEKDGPVTGDALSLRLLVERRISPGLDTGATFRSTFTYAPDAIFNVLSFSGLGSGTTEGPVNTDSLEAAVISLNARVDSFSVALAASKVASDNWKTQANNWKLQATNANTQRDAAIDERDDALDALAISEAKRTAGIAALQ